MREIFSFIIVFAEPILMTLTLCLFLFYLFLPEKKRKSWIRVIYTLLILMIIQAMGILFYGFYLAVAKGVVG